jgi:hypothetical protein
MSLSTLKDHVTGTNSAMLSQDRHLMERLAKSQYTHLMDLQLPCIPGQTATWLEFLTMLEKPMHLVTTINDEILVPFERYISMAMVDPERFSNATSRAKVDIVNFDDMREGFKNTIGGNRHIATRRYRELCARNIDMAEVIRLTRMYQTAAAKTNPRLIADRVKDLRELTTRLSENIKDANQSFRLSSKTIANISEAAFNIAEAVEMYATTMTFLNPTSRRSKPLKRKWHAPRSKAPTLGQCRRVGALCHWRDMVQSMASRISSCRLYCVPDNATTSAYSGQTSE